MKLPTRVVTKFRPPKLEVGPQGEFMVPLMHSNEKSLRLVKRMLRGEKFHVKALGEIQPTNDGRGYVLIVKFKPGT